MKYQTPTLIGIAIIAVVGGAYLYEQLKVKPKQHPNMLQTNTANLDNSALATAEVQAYGPFQIAPPVVPASPWEWAQFQSAALQGATPTQANGGIAPGGAVKG